MAGVLPHVAHVISSVDPRAGGITTQLVSLVKAQVELGMTVTVISTFANEFDSSAAETMRGAGAYVELIGPSTAVTIWHPKISRVLRDVIRVCDIVHIHGLWDEIQHRAAVIARELDVPYLFSLHGTLEPWLTQQSRLKKQIYMAVRMKKNLAGASVLHYSDGLEQELTAGWRLRAPAIVQPYAIDLAAFDRLPGKGMFRRAYPQVSDAPYLLFLGRLHPRKGLDVLIPAFKQGAPPEAKLVIAGPIGQEGYDDELRALARYHRLDDRVIFTGMLRGNVRSSAFAEARLFAQPSRSGSFGTAAIEALACGTPVIVSEQIALARTVARNQAGEVSPVEVSALGERIGDWMNNPDRCEATGAHGRDWVFRTFDAKSTAVSWAQHYDDILHNQIGLPGTPVPA